MKSPNALLMLTISKLENDFWKDWLNRMNEALILAVNKETINQLWW